VNFVTFYALCVENIKHVMKRLNESVSSNVMHDSQSAIKQDHVLTSASNKMLG